MAPGALAKMTIGEESYRDVELVTAGLIRLERRGVISRAKLQDMLEELAGEVADEWLAKQVAGVA